MNNLVKPADICQANYTYAKEVGGEVGDKILTRLENLGFLGNDEMTSDEFVGGTLLAYNALRKREEPFQLVRRK